MNDNEDYYIMILKWCLCSMEKGMNQRSLDIARNMLADGVDLNLIMKYSGLTQEQIEKLK